MFLPGKRLDGGTTPVLERLAVWEIHVGHLGEALRGALRESSEAEEDASNQATVATTEDWWHLR